MMYTNQENLINNKSYTNKDFLSIFPELLDAVKKLTNKWDPSISNESDPGVVLLKLGALLADKNNYNIDKNILETFPLSVTLRSNAMKLYDMLGYNMGWYKSSIADITFTYTGDLLGRTGDNTGSNAKLSNITIPRFTLLTDDSGKINYTLVEDVILSERGMSETGMALQGTLVEYEVNGIRNITIDNLDAEGRLFFTDRQVAQNGIFIFNIDNVDNEWEVVSNLESTELGRRVYKFGIMPNTETCYIQFPLDIDKLIGAGINIKYLITDGLVGNVSARTITSFAHDFTVTVSKSDGSGDEEVSINNDMSIRNTASTNSGADPEDIDEAYHNYKRTIGTFNTLVTLLDYENAIYSAKDTYFKPYVSNCVVSDRTCDINDTVYVVQPQQNMNTRTLLKGESMDAFSIGLYVLNPMVDIYDTDTYYNRSFSATATLDDVKQSIRENKVASHDFLDFDSGEVNALRNLPYIFKSFYKLEGKVSTYYKVTKEQAEDIEEKIREALYKRYNARNVNFGQPIDYDDIVSTIKSADTRINYVSLVEPLYQPIKYITYSDKEGTYDKSKSIFDADFVSESKTCLALDLLAKMILGGNVQLYKFDEDISYKFGQTNIKQYPDVTNITTKSVISGNDFTSLTGANGYTVKSNLNILVYSPNLYVQKSYVSYVNYSLLGFAPTEFSGEESRGKWTVAVDGKTYEVTKSTNGTGTITTINLTDSNNKNYPVQSLEVDATTGKINGKVTLSDERTYNFVGAMVSSDIISSIDLILPASIPQNTYYKLKYGLTIYINYTDTNKVVHFEKIEAGEIVRFIDNNDPTTVLKNNDKSTITKNDVNYSTLSAGQLIDVLGINKKEFTGSSLYCLWVTNDIKVETSDDNKPTKKSYILFKLGKEERLLLDGEFFIYTNADKNELVMLGSGTLLKRKRDDVASSAGLSEVSYRTTVNLLDIVSEGGAAILETDWCNYTLGENSHLWSIETQIVTFGEDAVVKCTIPTPTPGSGEQKPTQITNSPVKVSNVLYKETDDDGASFISLPTFDCESTEIDGVYVGWKMSSKLNLMIGSSVPLLLYEGLTITINGETKEEDKDIKPTSSSDFNKYILSNNILAFSGGENLSITSSNVGSKINIYSYDLSIGFTVDTDDDNSISCSYENYANLIGNSKSFELPFGFDGTSDNFTPHKIRVPVRLVGARDNDTVKLSPMYKLYSFDGKAWDDSTPEGDDYNSNIEITTLIAGSPNGWIEFEEYKDETTRRVFCGVKISNWTLSNANNTSLSVYFDDIRVNDLSSEYSQQVSTTVHNISQIIADKNTTGIAGIEELAYDYLMNKIDHCMLGSVNNSVRFDKTYVVDKSDMIDTDNTIEMYKNDLFSPDAIWDANHICNKYVIPLMMTDKSSIKVMSLSIK